MPVVGLRIVRAVWAAWRPLPGFPLLGGGGEGIVAAVGIAAFGVAARAV